MNSLQEIKTRLAAGEMTTIYIKKEFERGALVAFSKLSPELQELIILQVV